MKYFKHKIDFWRKNKPKRIGEYSVTKDEWDNIVKIISRFNKPIGFSRIKRLYGKYIDNKLKKEFLNYLKPDTEIEAIKEHSLYLTYLYDQEKKRQDNIDSKAKQIITNVSLLFAVIAFSSSIILNKDNYVSLYSEISLISVGISLLLALITLIIAIKITNARRYHRPRHEIVFNTANYAEKQFHKQKTTDFTACLFFNMQINKSKSSKVIVANQIFIISILFVFIFTFSNLIALNKRHSIKEIPKIEQIRIIDKVNVKIVDSDSIMTKNKKNKAAANTRYSQ